MSARDSHNLFFAILDARETLPDSTRRIRLAIENDDRLKRSADISRALRQFEKSYSRQDAQSLFDEIGKFEAQIRRGIPSALRLIMALHFQDLESELACGQILLWSYFWNEDLATEVRSNCLIRALGFFGSASGASEMSTLRFSSDLHEQARLHGYRLASDIKALKIPDTFFSNLVDEMHDQEVQPGDRYPGSDNDGRSDLWHPTVDVRSGLPIFLCGQLANDLYETGYANATVAGGVIVARVRARFPQTSDLCDQVTDRPLEMQRIWRLIGALRGLQEFDAGQEIEALIFVAAQHGDKRALLESATFAMRRCYHDADLSLMKVALGMLAVASGSRPIVSEDESGNPVDTAVGQAGDHLFGKITEAVTAEHKKSARPYAAKWLRSEQAAADERRADEAAEAEQTEDDVVTDDAATDHHAKPDSGETPKSPLQALKQGVDHNARLEAHRAAARRAMDDRRESVKIILEIGNADISGSETKAHVAKLIALLSPRRMHPGPEDLNGWRAGLMDEFPHARNVIDTLFADLTSLRMIGKRGMMVRPTLLVGRPGCGKSRLARRVAETAGLAYRLFPCGGVSDSHFAGLSRGWSSGHPSMPLDLMRAANIPNPLVIMDEIEKAGVSKNNGNLLDSILSMLETETSARWTDPYVQGPICLNAVNWIFTANTLTGLPTAFLDRVRIAHVDIPTAEHLPTLVTSIMKDLVASAGHSGWLPPLEPWELAAVTKAWRPNPSIRWLRCLVDACLRAREQSAPRH